jgi:predicted RNase H-like nuclease (RuvC/YqgF family)
MVAVSSESEISQLIPNEDSHIIQYKKAIESALQLTDQIEMETFAIINETDATKQAIHKLQTLQSETAQQTGQISKELEELKLRNETLIDHCVQKEQEISDLKSEHEQQISVLNTNLKDSNQKIELLDSELTDLKTQSENQISDLKQR